VSHDLRTPLNAVIGFSDVMDSELLGPVGHPRYREYARHIRDSGRDLLKSAEDTLALTSLLARKETRAAPSSWGLRSLANDAWDFFVAETQDRNIDLVIDAPVELELTGERRPLRQILINLLAEAIDRVADGHTITLRAEVDSDLVNLEIIVPGQAASSLNVNPSLSVCLARALLDLQGAQLQEIDDESCAWRAVTILGCSAQADFSQFSEAGYEMRAAHAC
jgi:K+-sensing histidine kinase KdpD